MKAITIQFTIPTHKDSTGIIFSPEALKSLEHQMLGMEFTLPDGTGVGTVVDVDEGTSIITVELYDNPKIVSSLLQGMWSDDIFIRIKNIAYNETILTYRRL